MPPTSVITPSPPVDAAKRGVSEAARPRAGGSVRSTDLHGGVGTLFLSVVVPVRDEVEALPPLMDELEKELGSIEGGVEFIFVDDASVDGSFELTTVRSEVDPRFRAVALAAHAGQSAALDRGFKTARGRVIVTLDADGQNDPADIPRMLRLLDEGEVDVVCGVRVQRHDPWHRRLISRVSNDVRNRLTGEEIRDVGCSLRVIRSEALRGLDLERGLHRFLPTLLRLRGALLTETPVAHRPRVNGRSKYGVFDRLPQALRDLWTVRRMQAEARRGGP